MPQYPDLQQVPGYPVYYAPGMNSNYFFYDGMYWVYQRDNWYASSWYNGPWQPVAPDSVPLFILRVPVRYYREPPAYFRGWQGDAPPQWGVHWGRQWEEHRRGWDRWNHQDVPAPAPLPTYQRQFSGGKYPHGEQQQALHQENYRYQPKDAAVEHVYHQQAAHHAAAPMQKGPPPPPQGQEGGKQETERSRPGPAMQPQTALPRPEPGKREGENMQRPASGQPHTPVENRPEPQPTHQMQKEAPPREQPAQRPQQERPQQMKSAPPEPKQVRPTPENRPAEKAAPPHEPPPAKKEEKREEERK